MYAIEAANLTKHYRVYLRPVDRLKEAITRRPHHKEVEALHGISFRVPVGGTLGIIGENGAGKSTLLKILAGTTTPTSGHFIRNGRVAALLELGSGFHPEFSGRGNIHLNAALLGLSEQEIKEREQSIIDFSELGEAIERPVKTYSSGMHIRLAFSIATSVDPDTLIIDEALSVGDQYFQKKCIDRMVGFKAVGKTIVFCSHSMYQVGQLCENALWLMNGRLNAFGPAAETVAGYLAYQENKVAADSPSPQPDPECPIPPAPPKIIVEKIYLSDDRGHSIHKIEQFQPVTIKIITRCLGPDHTGHLGVAIKKPDNQLIFGITTKEDGLEPITFSGTQMVELVIPSCPLMSGAYQAAAIVADSHALVSIHENASDLFTITGKRPELGMFWIDHTWRVSPPASG